MVAITKKTYAHNDPVSSAEPSAGELSPHPILAKTVEEMCAEMVAADLDTARSHALLKAHGHHGAVSKE